MIEFIEDGHRYFVKGREYMSVTKAIRLGGLAWYPDDTGALERGRAVHVGMHLIIKGTLDWRSVTPEIAGYLRAWERFLIEQGIVPIDAEVRVADHVHRIAGRYDLKCKVRNFGLGYVDGKSVSENSTSIASSTGPQIAKYAMCDGHPEAIRIAAGLKPDGSYFIRVYKVADVRIEAAQVDRAADRAREAILNKKGEPPCEEQKRAAEIMLPWRL